jgi:putative redox protein
MHLPTKTEIEHMIKRLKSEPQYGLNPNRVRVVRLVQRFRCEAQAGPFVFVSDEPDERGGRGEGPAPLEYFLAGFAFCQLSIGAAHAALMNLQLDSVEISVRGFVNERGCYGFPGVSAAMQDIKYEIRIQSPESPERIREWLKAVEDGCPAYNTLRHPPPLQRQLVLNGNEIPIYS